MKKADRGELARVRLLKANVVSLRRIAGRLPPELGREVLRVAQKIENRAAQMKRRDAQVRDFGTAKAASNVLREHLNG